MYVVLQLQESLPNIPNFYIYIYQSLPIFTEMIKLLLTGYCYELNISGLDSTNDL